MNPSQNSHGLKYSIPPFKLNKTDILATFDIMHRVMLNDIKDTKDKGKLKSEISFIANNYVDNYKPSKSTMKKHVILKRLRSNKQILILKPDKGSGIVILNRNHYDKMLNDMISDQSKFKKLKSDPTKLREGQLQRYLLSLNKKNVFSKEVYETIYPNGSTIARIYGLPKTHKLNTNKDNLKLRPIISSINTFNYNLAKYLCNKLSPYIPTNYSTKDTFSFIHTINDINPTGKYMISFDVNSLFTNIPLNETIDIAVDLLIVNEPNIGMTKCELKKLFQFATSKSHFLFNDEVFDQVDGVAMGSPLGPVLANVFMGYHEKFWIENYNGIKPDLYTRYVDDIFCLFKSEDDAMLFFEYLNNQLINISFTHEKESNGSLSFLDVLIKTPTRVSLRHLFSERVHSQVC